MVKLAKMMFYSDFLAFKNLGESITGLEYRKLPQGPVPTKAKAIQSHLVAEGKAYEREGTFGRIQLIPVDRFNRKNFEGTFSEKELDIMDDVYEQIRPTKAGEISDLSHDFLGWQVANWEEVIPYATTLIQQRRLTQRELDSGSKLLKEMGVG